jgi:hypothetical protein
MSTSHIQTLRAMGGLALCTAVWCTKTATIEGEGFDHVGARFGPPGTAVTGTRSWIDASRIRAGSAMAGRHRETTRFEIGSPVAVMTCRIEKGWLAMWRRRRYGA